MADFEMRAGDTLPPLEGYVFDGTTPAEGLEGATLVVTVHKLPDVTVMPIDNYNFESPPPPPEPTLWFEAPGYIDLTELDPAGDVMPRFAYDWTNGQTDNAVGDYLVSWRLTTAEGVRTYPTNEAQTLVIVDPTKIIPPHVIVSPDDVASEYDLVITDPLERARLTRQIVSATKAAESYLHRSVKLAVFTEDRLLAGGIPNPGSAFDGVLGDLWGVTNLPLIQVLSIVPLSSGYFRITYIGGIDGTQYPGITDWISQRAASRFFAQISPLNRPPTSITVEGQSLSYFNRAADSIPDPPVTDLNRYKVRTVFSRPRTRDPYIQRG